jgi:hypothetical protein
MPLTWERIVNWNLAIPVLCAALLVPVAAHADDAKRRCVAASTEGQALRDGTKLTQARDRFLACARDECPAVVRKYCAEWLGDVEKKLPTVVLRVQTADGADARGARVTVDGKSVALDGSAIPIDPGDHAVHAEVEGAPAIDQQVLVAEGEKDRLVTLRFAAPAVASTPAPPSTPPAPVEHAERPFPVVPVVLAGVGVAAMATSVVFWRAASSDVDDLRARCAPRCDSSDVDSAKGKALVSNVAFGVGVVAFGLAAYTFLTRGPAEPTPAASIDVRPTVGGAVAQVGARF